MTNTSARLNINGAASTTTGSKVFVTGGASANDAIVQVLSNVFGLPVFGAEQTGSAALGAAYRAKHGHVCAEAGEFVQFSDVMAGAEPMVEKARPDGTAAEIYSVLMARYEALEKQIAG